MGQVVGDRDLVKQAPVAAVAAPHPQAKVGSVGRLQLPAKLLKPLPRHAPSCTALLFW